MNDNETITDNPNKKFGGNETSTGPSPVGIEGFSIRMAAPGASRRTNFRPEKPAIKIPKTVYNEEMADRTSHLALTDRVAIIGTIIAGVSLLIYVMEVRFTAQDKILEASISEVKSIANDVRADMRVIRSDNQQFTTEIRTSNELMRQDLAATKVSTEKDMEILQLKMELNHATPDATP